MRPAKCSPHTEFPPRRSGADDTAAAPVCAAVATSVPPTYRRIAAPS